MNSRTALIVAGLINSSSLYAASALQGTWHCEGEVMGFRVQEELALQPGGSYSSTSIILGQNQKSAGVWVFEDNRLTLSRQFEWKDGTKIAAPHEMRLTLSALTNDSFQALSKMADDEELIRTCTKS